MLPDISTLIEQKLVKNTKKKNNPNATFFVIFKQCVVKEAQKRCLDNILMLHIYEMYKKFHHFIISQDTQDGQALKAAHSG